MKFEPVTIERVKQFNVVREDLIKGGTKRRALNKILPLYSDVDEFVYPATADAKGQLALAYAANDVHRHATIFVARRERWSQFTQEAAMIGAKIVEVEAPAFLSVVNARANDYAEERPSAKKLPIGFLCDDFITAIADVAREIEIAPPKEVWAACGSGALTRGLMRAWPKAQFHVVQYGMKSEMPEGVKVYHAPEEFKQDAKKPPPFDSTAKCDAKMWQFVTKHARPGALIWNL